MTTFSDGGLVFSSFAASTDLSSAQYKIVQLASTAGQVKLATSATSKCIGVLVNDPNAAGQPALIQYGGIAKVLAETSVSASAVVGSSSTGRAKTVSSENDRAIGIALEASAKAGDLIRVLMNVHNY